MKNGSIQKQIRLVVAKNGSIQRKTGSLWWKMDLYSAKQALCGEKWIHTEGKRLVVAKNGSIQKEKGSL